MKRQLNGIPAVVLFAALIILCAFTPLTAEAVMPIGTIVGEVLSTDIVAVIDDKPIPSMNINGYTAIIVEDLRDYGFKVNWNEQQKTLQVRRNEAGEAAGKPFEPFQGEPGQRLYHVLHTDIRTYIDHAEVVSFNIDGQTAIFFNQLKPYGLVEWNDLTRVASLSFPLPIVEEEPVVVPPPVVTRRTTNLDPDMSMQNHKPIDKANMPELISVGLYFDASSVPMLQLTSPDGFAVGEFVQDTFQTLFIVSDQNRIHLLKDDGYYLGLISPYKSVDEAERRLKETENQRMTPVLAREAHGWNVYLGPFRSTHDVLDYMMDEQLDDREWTRVSPSFTRVRAENHVGKSIFIYESDVNLYLASLEAADDSYASIVQVNQTKYRGMVTAFRKPGQNLTVVNRLPLEQYLYGVVPKEMPHSWNIEALKAQAVAARGFALANIGKWQSNGFDVCTTVNTQVYGGYTSEQPSTNRAVDQTAGKVMSYQGKLIIPYYHSNSGGQTESSENIWSAALPYARGVDDPFSMDASNSRWEVTYTGQEIENMLRNHQIEIGTLDSVWIEEISPNGRVIKMVVEGSHGQAELMKEQTRWVFGLRSNYYEISRNDNDYVFTGQGYGHGVGMSQFGARSMADANYSWQDILYHYYTGIRIE